MRNRLVPFAVVIALALVFSLSAQAASIATRVCALMDETPFSPGAETFAAGEGCTWGLSGSDGVTIENEEIRATIATSLSQEELAQARTTYSQMLHNVEEMGYQVTPFPVCDGGEQVVSSAPTLMAYFTCHGAFYDVSITGAKSMEMRERLITGLQGIH